MEDLEKSAANSEEEKAGEENSGHDAAYWEQQFQQREASEKRANERANALQAQIEAESQKTTELQDAYSETLTKLEEVEAKLNAPAYGDAGELADEGLKKNQQLLINKLDTLEKRQAEQDAKIARYETQAKKDADRDYREATIERICKPLDDEFGAKHRAAAIKLGEKWIADGVVTQPKDAIDAAHLTRKCYMEVSKKTETPSFTDTGKSSKTIPAKTGKPGTHEEVMADLRSR